LTVGGLVAGTSQLPWWARAATGCGLLAPLLLYRPLLAAVLERLGRWLRLDRQEVEPPPQAVMLRSFAWVLVPVLAAGLAFALLVGSLGPEVGWAHATASFALAWAVGFAALPFPSGLGVREAVLVALVGAGTAQVLAASLTLRLVTIGAELVMIVASRRGLR
ncbi:MAG: lysylphosphatidylglycerol synthase domain-containing protein, partial [Acidimicrobiia bacterium]